MFCRRPHYPKNWGLTAFTRPSMVMVRLVAPYGECPHIQRTVYVCSGVGRGTRHEFADTHLCSVQLSVSDRGNLP